MRGYGVDGSEMVSCLIENEQSKIFLDYGKGDGIVTKAILMNSLLL